VIHSPPDPIASRTSRRLLGALTFVVLLVTSFATGAASSPAEAAAGAPTDPWPGLALPREFADPAALADGDRYVFYSTESGGLHIPAVTSTDLRSWSAPVDALPERPRWSRSGPVWAPAATRRADGAYLLAFATLHHANGQMCVSVAVSDRATGPFVDRSTAPLVCDHGQGGAIDPSFFVDADGATWLLWKSEGVPGRHRSRLHSQRIDPVTLTRIGAPHELLGSDLPWEHPIVENPAMALIDGTYVLLYSANRWETSRYATGWALCTGPAGPCHKAPRPLMVNDRRRSGPGGASWFLTANDHPWIAYHGWKDGRAGHPDGGQRALYLAHPTLQNGVLQVIT
jgi:beta-xylosidase